jgi:SAM-dependent methyltransferase
MPKFNNPLRLLPSCKNDPLSRPKGLDIVDTKSLDLVSDTLSVVPSLEAAIVSPSSPAYQEASQLQTQRFARATKPGPKTPYLETVDFQHTIPLVIRRRDASQPEQLVGTVLLELPSASVIESVVQFQPGSQSAQAIVQGTFAEIRGFATRFDIGWQAILDVVDTIGSMMVQIANQRKIEWFWIVPRQPLIGLLLAEIPGLLPPLHFTLCTDVVGWNEENERLLKMRSLRMKELPIAPGTLPILIQITPAQWAEDLARRLELLEQRHQEPDFPRLLQNAMRQARQHIENQVAQLYALTDKKEKTMLKPGKRPTEPAAPVSPVALTPVEPAAPAPQEKDGFLPFTTTQGKAIYLRQVVEQGGEAATSYKTLSYDLLQLEPGRQVLDVGCGIGVDLPALAERVGTDGLVIGLDHDPNLLKAAKEASAGRSNVRLVVAEALELPFPNRSFDAVRADRVLQYIPESAQALDEMARVLRPGGILALVEPDWRAISLLPASPAGGDDDHTWSAIAQMCQRRLPHALMGRQLAALLQRQGNTIWEQVQAQVVAYTFLSWQVTNTLLQISNLAQALIQEEPARTDEINAWLQAIETAALRNEFFACVPMFFAYAQKK